MKRFYWISIVGWIWLMGISMSVAAFPTPIESLSSSVDKILRILQDKGIPLGKKRESIRALINERFDFITMSKQILGKNWSRASAEQKDSFVQLYARMLQNTYLVLVEEYSGEAVIYKHEMRKDKFASVDTLVSSSSRQIPVVYKCIIGADGWYVYDVVIEGISMVSNYRNTFASVIRQKGMDGLLADLQAKVNAPVKTASDDAVSNQR